MTTAVVVAITAVGVLWLTTQPASADPAGWEIDNSGGWLPGPCPDWVDTDPEDVTCEPQEIDTGKDRVTVWGHVNFWDNAQTGQKRKPFENCPDVTWKLEDYLTDKENPTEAEPKAAEEAAEAAAKIGRGCLHNESWPWVYNDHDAYAVETEDIKIPQHRWVRRKAAHTNCGTEWPESHIHPDGELDVPDAPKDATEAGLNHFHWTVRVTWGAPDDDGGCPVLGYEVRVTAANDPPGTAPVTHHFTDTRFPHEEPVPTVATGVKTVEIRARNVKGLGDPARVRLHPRCPRGTDHQGDLISSVDGGTEAGCNDESPPDVCPLPAAPTVTKHGFRTRGGITEQEVRWEVDDPAGAGCEVTGWLIYYGTDAAREKDRHETSSYERKPVPGSRIRVFVRAENPVRPGSTAKQLGNSGDVDLYGDDVTGGALRRTHR